MSGGQVWSYDQGKADGNTYSTSQQARSTVSSLPAERAGSLKSAIDDQLRANGVYAQIQSLLAEMGEKDPANLTSERALAALEERGVIEKVVKGIRGQNLEGVRIDGQNEEPSTAPLPGSGVTSTPKRTTKPTPRVNTPSHRAWRRDPLVALSDALQQQRMMAEADRAAQGMGAKRFAHVQLLGGKAFLFDHSSSESGLQVHACFQGQRFCSRPQPCVAEPGFDDMFLFELDAADKQSSDALLRLSEPIHLVVTKHSDKSDRTELVRFWKIIVSSSQIGTHALEWRHALCTGSAGITVEVAGPGSQSKLPVGLLEIRLEILPRPTDLPLPEHVEFQLRRERSDQSDWARRFFSYAQGWWEDYHDIRPANASRNVSLFSLTEGGISVPVSSFVKPIGGGRLLESPLHACRLVSLLPPPPSASLHTDAPTWDPMHTVLAKHSGTSSEKSALLASLLLGFGLDAYVVMGSLDGDGHTWVITLDSMGGAMHWDAVTGYRVGAGSELGGPFAGKGTVGCLFNNQHFYANIQPSDAIDVCSFNVSDRSLWKSLPEEIINAAAHSPISALSMSLTDSSLDIKAIEKDAEQMVVNAVTERRTGHDLSTNWDDRLSYLLSPALTAYEYDCLLTNPGGSTAGLSNPIHASFEQSVKGAVPTGHTFKAYPVQHTHCSMSRISSSLWHSHSACDVADTRGDEVRFGVRARAYVYPDNAIALWIVVAVTFRDTHHV